MDKDRNQKKDKVIESCIKVLDIGAMRQREEFMSSFRKTTSLFVPAVIGFFLSSFLFFFSLCGLYLRRDYAHVIRKTSPPLCPLRSFFALCTAYLSLTSHYL